MSDPNCGRCRGFGYTKGAPGAPWEKVDCTECSRVAVTRPVTPEEVSRVSTSFSRSYYEQYLNEINRLLLDGGLAISRRLIPEEIIDRVLEDYRAAGWDVHIVADFRDGDYLNFRRR